MSLNNQINYKSQTLLPAIASLAVFVVVYFTASSSFPNLVKGLITATFVIGFLVVLFVNGKRNKNAATYKSPESDEKTADSVLLEEELASLEEAAVFFSASIAPEELGRLLSTRLENVMTGYEVDFYFPDRHDQNDELIRFGSRLLNSAAARSARSDLAFKAISASRVTYSKDLKRSAESISENTLAVPLFRGSEAFGAVTIATQKGGDVIDTITAEMIAVRVAPLIAGSLAYQSSVDNALTDELTRLPNERALFLVLENQVAESERFGPERPLAVLAVDIESFDEINAKYGHAVGDKVLAHAGNLIKDNLRKMDFLARTSDDEFYVVLPKAGSEPSAQVIARLRHAFEENPFKEVEVTIDCRPCFGSAVFGEDSETAAGLLRRASENKRVAKSAPRGSILKFPVS